MARFNEKVGLRPVNTDLAQPFFTHAQNMQQFAAETGQIGRQMASAAEAWGQFADKKSIARGKQQAEADIAQGNLTDRKTGPSMGDKAYNDLMRNAYLQSLASDTEMDLRKIESESQSLEQYNQTIDAYKKGKLKELEPEISAGYALTFDKLSHSGRMRLQEKEIDKNRRVAVGELERTLSASIDTVQRLVNEGTPDEINFGMDSINSNIAALREEDGYTFDEAWEGSIRTKIAKTISNQGFYRDIDSAIQSGGIEGGYAKLEDLASETPAGYSPAEWEEVLSKKWGELAAMERAAKKKIKEDAKAIEAANLYDRGLYLFTTGTPIDPYKTNEQSKYDLSAINSVYDTAAVEWESLPPSEFVKNNTDFVSRVGVVPLELERKLNAVSRSGSPEQVVLMSEVYSRIQQDSPQAIKDMPDETRAILASISEASRAGQDIQTAIDAARKNAYGLSKQEREAIKITSAEWKANNNKKLLADLKTYADDDFAKGFVGYFAGAPDLPPEMQAEFSMNFDKHMTLSGGNPEVAKALAYQDVKKTWGTTSIGGDKRFMKYSPEAVYSIPGVDDSWMSDQFNSEMSQIGVEGATITVNAFEAARTGKPSYSVMKTNPDTGLPEPVIINDNGVPRRAMWRPDFTKTDEYQVMAAPQVPSDLSKFKETRAKKIAIEQRKSIGRLSNRLGKGYTVDQIDSAVSNAIAVGDAKETDREMLKTYFTEKLNANSNY